MNFRLSLTKLGRSLAWLLGFVLAGSAGAATYTLPSALGASPFTGCIFSSGTTYSCNSTIKLPAGSTVLLTSSIILNITGGFESLGSSEINNNGSGFTLLIKTTEDVKLSSTTGTVSFDAGSKTIDILGNVNITGNLTAGTINIGGSSTITGVCTPSNAKCTGGATVPTITTQAATSVTTSSATLNGTVSSNGATTTVSFGYSTTSGSYTSTCTPATSSFVGTASGQAFSCSLTGLSCGTTYYFRASGNNSAGTTNGGELSFSTSACPPSSFTAYESNISNTSAATAANRVITTRVASTSGNLCPNGVSGTASTLPSGAKTCSLTVAGFAAGAVATTYSGTVSVKLQYCSNVSRAGSGAASTVSCGGTWVDLSAAQNVTLASGVGVATFGFVNNAYEVVRVQISSATVTGGPWNSDDLFAIRPTGLTVTATDATSSTAGSTRSLTSGANTHKAGQPFTLNAQAYVTTNGTTASNYPGTGAGPVSQSVVTTSPTVAAGGVSGTVAVGTWSGTGTVTSSTASYYEVGTFNLTLEDQDFANVDKADGSTTAERYFSGTASLGRFTPDHFLTAVTAGCSTFTYSGQPMTVTITAYNGLGTPAATRNYGLTTNTVTLSDAGTTTSFSANTVASSSFAVVTGQATTTTPAYTFASRTTAPTGITVRATDLDSITSSGFESAAGTTIVSGRLNLLNAYGSEKLALPLVTRVEYYDTATAAGWRQATSSYVDSCTKLAPANFAFTTVAPSCATAVSSCITQLSLAATLSAGSYISPWTVRLSQPSGAGSMCMTVNLDGAATGKQCISAVSVGTPATPGAIASSANAAWLQYPWTSTTASNPSAQVNFGVYRSPLIYRRENY